MRLDNDLYLRAALRQPVDRTPVWLMRQAGRYLPEYRELRSRVGDFMALCRDPDLACEAALQPLRRYQLDAAILFSDILTIPDAMGLGLHFVPGDGPRFELPIQSRSDVEHLSIPDPEGELEYVMQAVRTLRRSLDGAIPLIGFSGSPWTLATYMLAGRKKMAEEMVERDSATLHLLLNKLADSAIVYLNGQIRAGAQAVVIFDSWGGILGASEYQHFSLNYLQKIISGLIRSWEQRSVPITLFSRGRGDLLEVMAAVGCDVLGVDWHTDLSEARQRVGDRVALQGNLDPALLLKGKCSPSELREQVLGVLESYGQGSGHIFNLGHGIPQEASPESVEVLIKTVQQCSPKYHDS